MSINKENTLVIFTTWGISFKLLTVVMVDIFVA